MSILTEIIEYKKLEIQKQKENTRSFYNFLKAGNFALIAEVKKASPSKGIIKPDFNHIEAAKAYINAGASAISVLTEDKYFQGNINYLKDIRKITETPILRKDFIIDELQIYETKLIGADIILLIASALDKKQLTDFYTLSKEIGLDVLLEVHDRQEYATAVDVGAKIIGVNNRNLNTFEVKLENTLDIIKCGIPKDTFIISESGIQTKEDVALLKNGGVSGILVGEALMRENNIELAAKNLIE